MKDSNYLKRKRGLFILWLLLALAVLGLVAVVVVKKMNIQKQEPQSQVTQTDQNVEEFSKLSQSDEIGAIETDLDSTDLNKVDNDVLGDVDAAFGDL